MLSPHTHTEKEGEGVFGVRRREGNYVSLKMGKSSFDF